jgi:hypothetical protein
MQVTISGCAIRQNVGHENPAHCRLLAHRPACPGWFFDACANGLSGCKEVSGAGKLILMGGRVQQANEKIGHSQGAKRNPK